MVLARHKWTQGDGLKVSPIVMVAELRDDHERLTGLIADAAWARAANRPGSDTPPSAIPTRRKARREAVPGVRLCIACQELQDEEQAGSSGYNRRGSKDSQLR